MALASPSISLSGRDVRTHAVSAGLGLRRTAEKTTMATPPSPSISPSGRKRAGTRKMRACKRLIYIVLQRLYFRYEGGI